MQSLKTLRSQKGFSLVELMVVVAIIGILAVIGIPQYQKFMSKARQAEAKTHLNALFQGQISFFTEYNTYAGNLQAIGAGATGTGLRYNAGFENADACAGQTAALAVGEADGNNDIRSLAANPGDWFYNGAGIADPAATALIDCATLATTFDIGAWGNPTNVVEGTENNNDVFAINEQRALVQVSVGF